MKVLITKLTLTVKVISKNKKNINNEPNLTRRQPVGRHCVYISIVQPFI